MSQMVDNLPVLIGQNGPLNGHKWPVEDSITIGRDINCEIVIPDRQVSRFHARLTPETRGMLLEDLASKNGTFCNGTRIIEPIYIQDGDMIQIALIQHFVFLSSDSTMPVDFDQPEKILQTGLILDQRSRRVWINGVEVTPPLSVPQFRLLEILYKQQGKVVSRQDLILYIWGEEEALGVSEQALDALVRRLRDRLAGVNPDHQFIVTIRGHGLRLDNPNK